jgi:hypothetical protein
MPKRMVLARISGDSRNGADCFWCVICAIFIGIARGSQKPPVLFRSPSLYPVAPLNELLGTLAALLIDEYSLTG